MNKVDIYSVPKQQQIVSLAAGMEPETGTTIDRIQICSI